MRKTRIRKALGRPSTVALLSAAPLTLTLLVAEVTRGGRATLPVAIALTVAVAALAWWLAARWRSEQAAARRARQSLRRSAERSRALTENMLEALIVVDSGSVIEAVNPAACRMFGYEEGDLVGGHLGLLLPPEAAADAPDYLRDAHRKALGLVTEWEGRRRDGSRFPFELSMFTFEGAGGLRFGGLIRDVSERNRVDEAKRQFVSNVTHELRTPLTSIRGSLDLLASGALQGRPQVAAEVLGIAQRNTLRLIALVNDLLDLERLGQGTIAVHLAAVSPAQVVEHSVEVVAAMADQHGVELRVAGLGECPLVQADEQRVQQVLVNLASNAIKFSPRGGVVEVTAVPVDGAVEFRVDDQGRGVPVEMREAIFERFRQVRASDASEKGGTGLGLAISRAIVERHAGTIGVAEGAAGGSRFWFRIPTRVAAADSVFEPLPDGLAEGGVPRVLVVDDDEDHLALIARQMVEAGFAAETAISVQEALEAGRRRVPDLVVLDLNLRDGSGYDVVRAFREQPALRQTPLLVYTVEDVGAAQRQWLRLGPSCVLTKTRATNEELMAAARQLLRGEEPAVFARRAAA